MSQEQKQITFQEWYNNSRANIILSFESAKDSALRFLDDLSIKFSEVAKQNEALKQALEKESKDKKDPKNKKD